MRREDEANKREKEVSAPKRERGNRTKQAVLGVLRKRELYSTVALWTSLCVRDMCSKAVGRETHMSDLSKAHRGDEQGVPSVIFECASMEEERRRVEESLFPI
uniref:Uncharacterized protein n=1 Tax=Palpitomonas bilix TaxID=652834 RepID=A0A7S3D718_9EUKA|mmetsp:Transcript_22636/g.57699  ORF Transcript_22636/g.57699 Transcript_22636/m.57699 type:complete len:103 (+) Transcript_22636:557-865(+)